MGRKYEAIDVVLWTNTLRDIYERFVTKTALEYVVGCVYRMWNEGAEIALQIDTKLAPSQWYHLRGPVKELERFRSRLVYYYHHLVDEPEEVNRRVVSPLLYGLWPPDFPEQMREPQWNVVATGIEGRPDVTQVAMIRNQMVAGIRFFDELWAWWNLEGTLRNRLGELLMAAKREAFEKSAPGEPLTAREKLSAAIDEMIKDVEKIAKQAGAAGLFGVGVIAAAAATAILLAVLDKD